MDGVDPASSSTTRETIQFGLPPSWKYNISETLEGLNTSSAIIQFEAYEWLWHQKNE